MANLPSEPPPRPAILPSLPANLDFPSTSAGVGDNLFQASNSGDDHENVYCDIPLPSFSHEISEYDCENAFHAHENRDGAPPVPPSRPALPPLLPANLNSPSTSAGVSSASDSLSQVSCSDEDQSYV